MSQAMATQSISSADVVKAKRELDRMRGSLRSWLKFRTLNDAVAAGKAPSKLPVKVAQQVVMSERDWGTEQKLANQLHALLSELHPDAQLPNPSVQQNPQAAVQLAVIAIKGPTALAAPQATGIVWMWPVLIVGGLLLAVTTAIRSMADVAKEKERYACIRAGACTDYGFWLKVGGVAAAAWFAWTQTGLGDSVKSYLRKGSR